MDKAVVSEGDYNVRSAFFRMPAGLEIPSHFHPLWVQVMVVEGRMAVTDEAGITTIAEQGDCYFNPSGCRHVERALVDSIVLVTQADDRNPGL
jgi:quercetin dioxygenase-like cupin family protein